VYSCLASFLAQTREALPADAWAQATGNVPEQLLMRCSSPFGRVR